MRMPSARLAHAGRTLCILFWTKCPPSPQHYIYTIYEVARVQYVFLLSEPRTAHTPGECWPHQVFGWRVVVSHSRLSFQMVSVYLARCEPSSSGV